MENLIALLKDNVIVALISICITFISTLIYKKMISPFKEQKRSNAPITAYNWDIYYSNPFERAAGKVKFKTTPWAGIKGYGQTFFDRNGAITKRDFFLKGEFDSGSGQLSLLYEDKEMPGYLRGVAILKYSHEKGLLSGKSCFLYNDSGEFEVYDFYFKKRV